jgi:glycosyltransferase involved in cell wall biosynthesis
VATGRSILLVAQYSPPSFVVAARRVAGMTKYLARVGHRVTVLTSQFSGEGAIEGAEAVIRTSDLLASRFNWRQRRDQTAGGTAAVGRPPSRAESALVPDISALSWLPFALNAARGLEPDCVITTSPPQSAHLVGLRLSRRGIRWIAELRDGWRFDRPRGDWPLAAQRRLDSRLERSVVERANAVVAVTRPIAEDLERRYGRRVDLITNGFDPDDVGDDGGFLVDADRFSLVHTGSMGFTGGTSRPLVEALRLLEQEIAARLELVFAGLLSTQEAALLQSPELGGMVRTVGSLDRADVLRLQRSADALLVVTEGAKRPSVATGKLFEYLAADRPILVLGEETEAGRIVRETRRGTATSADDPERISDALRGIIQGGRRPALGGPELVDAYAWPRLAETYGALVDEVCRSTGASASATWRGR